MEIEETPPPEVEFLNDLLKYCYVVRRGPRRDIAAQALRWEGFFAGEIEKLTQAEPEAQNTRRKSLVAA